jgi:hypothetical protein
MKKSVRIRHNNTIDLHHIFIPKGTNVQDAVYEKLDRFMSRHLVSKTADLTIIVGKGLGSKNFIGGKNALRFYTEQYLQSVGCKWTDGDHWSGQEGTIRVRW